MCNLEELQSRRKALNKIREYASEMVSADKAKRVQLDMDIERLVIALIRVVDVKEMADGSMVD